MSSDSNKAVIRRYREMHNQNRLDQLGDVLAADFIAHNMLPGLPGGLDGARMAHAGFMSAFPDAQAITEDLVAEGDRVVERYTLTGTNTGSFLGAPPTGKPIRTGSIAIYRLKDDKIVEHWGEHDGLGVMMQLGLMPTPNP